MAEERPDNSNGEYIAEPNLERFASDDYTQGEEPVYEQANVTEVPAPEIDQQAPPVFLPSNDEHEPDDEVERVPMIDPNEFLASGSSTESKQEFVAPVPMSDQPKPATPWAPKSEEEIPSALVDEVESEDSADESEAEEAVVTDEEVVAQEEVKADTPQPEVEKHSSFWSKPADETVAIPAPSAISETPAPFVPPVETVTPAPPRVVKPVAPVYPVNEYTPGLPPIVEPVQEKSNKRFPWALVLAVLALVLAGVALASSMGVLPGSGVVTSKNVKDGSLTAADFNSASLPKGERGEPGAIGPQGQTGETGEKGSTGSISRVITVTADSSGSGATQTATATCTGSNILIGGGANVSSDSAFVTSSSADGTKSWKATASRPDGTDTFTVTATALCAQKSK